MRNSSSASGCSALQANHCAMAGDAPVGSREGEAREGASRLGAREIMQRFSRMRRRCQPGGFREVAAMVYGPRSVSMDGYQDFMSADYEENSRRLKL